MRVEVCTGIHDFVCFDLLLMLGLSCIDRSGGCAIPSGMSRWPECESSIEIVGDRRIIAVDRRGVLVISSLLSARAVS